MHTFSQKSIRMYFMKRDFFPSLSRETAILESTHTICLKNHAKLVETILQVNIPIVNLLIQANVAGILVWGMLVTYLNVFFFFFFFFKDNREIHELMYSMVAPPLFFSFFFSYSYSKQSFYAEINQPLYFVFCACGNDNE